MLCALSDAQCKTKELKTLSVVSDCRMDYLDFSHPLAVWLCVGLAAFHLRFIFVLLFVLFLFFFSFFLLHLHKKNIMDWVSERTELNRKLLRTPRLHFRDTRLHLTQLLVTYINRETCKRALTLDDYALFTTYCRTSDYNKFYYLLKIQLLCWLQISLVTKELLIILVFSKIQLVEYYQCCFPIGWATNSAGFETQNNGGWLAFCLLKLFCLDIFDQLVEFY